MKEAKQNIPYEVEELIYGSFNIPPPSSNLSKRPTQREINRRGSHIYSRPFRKYRLFLWPHTYESIRKVIQTSREWALSKKKCPPNVTMATLKGVHQQKAVEVHEQVSRKIIFIAMYHKFGING